MADRSLLRRLVTSPYVLLIFPPLFWAANAIIGRVAAGEISPYALSFWRWILALAVMLPFTMDKMLRHWPTIRRHWLFLIVIGCLSVGSFNVLLYVALETTTAINATLVGASTPLLIMLLSLFILKEPLGLWRSVGLVLSLFGVTMVIARGDLDVLLNLDLHLGDGLMIFAMFTWALFSVLIRAFPVNLPPMVFLTAQIAGGMVLVAPLYLGALAFGGGQLPITWESAAIVGFTAFFPALAAFFLWNKGVHALGATVAGFYINLVPLFTAGLAALLLGEIFAWYHAVGLALIFSGIGLATRFSR